MKIEPINLPDGNVLLVDKDKDAENSFGISKAEYDIPDFERIIYDFRNEINSHCLDFWPILASTTEINPSIPLFREEDLKGKDRYELLKSQTGFDEFIWEIKDHKTGKLLHLTLHNEKIAQDYCNYLNSKHEQVDVEELANKKWPNWYSDYEDGEARRNFINGFNANKQGGYSEEDMSRLFTWCCYQKETNSIEEFKQFLTSLTPPTTIKLKQENGVIVTQEIDGRNYVVFEN